MYFYILATSAGQYANFKNDTAQMYESYAAPFANYELTFVLPVSKADKYTIRYSGTGASVLRFIYSLGAQ